MSNFLNIHFLFEVTVVGLVLSADSFSAAVAMGHRPFSNKDAYRFAFSSGSAEALVALFGALAGGQIIKRFAAIDHWIAFGLLAIIALHMAYEGIKDLLSKEVKEEKLDFHSFGKVLLVSFATSLDAFGVGIGLGISDKPIAPYIISIGFWAFTTTIIGLHLAKRLSEKFGPIMNIVGAIVLGIMAFQMLKI
jgi:putative Mn2+ efflux pump MntP